MAETKKGWKPLSPGHAILLSKETRESFEGNTIENLPPPPFTLESSKEGKEIRERLLKEFFLRTQTLKQALDECKMPIESVMLTKPVFDRTDFGYHSDVDISFFGTKEERSLLYKKSQALNLDIVPRWIPTERMEEIKNLFPELHEHLVSQKGNLAEMLEGPTVQQRLSGDNFSEIETQIRKLLDAKQKEELRTYRLRAAGRIIDTIRERLHVVAYNISGSTNQDSEGFGICSDLDIEMLIDGEKSQIPENLIFLYLGEEIKSICAEKGGFKFDHHDENVTDIKTRLEEKLVTKERENAYLQRVYGIGLEDLKL